MSLIIILLLIFIIIHYNKKKKQKQKDLKSEHNLTITKDTQTTPTAINNTIKIKKPYYVRKVYDEFIAIDFETTGLNYQSDKIIEVSAIKFKNGKIEDTFHTLVNPQRRIPHEIVRMTGITEDMVKDKPTIEEVLPSLMDFIKGKPLVAHNASFDISFLKYNIASQYGEDLISNPVIDTLNLSRSLFPGLPNYKLTTVSKHLKTTVDNSHRAYDDAFASGQIYLYYCELEKVENKEAKNINISNG